MAYNYEILIPITVDWFAHWDETAFYLLVYTREPLCTEAHPLVLFEMRY